MTHYTASITYSAETIQLLEKAIFDAFGLRSLLIRFLISFVMFGIGLYLQGPTGLLLIFLGAILLTAGNFLGSIRGQKLSSAMGGQQVKVDYQLRDDRIYVKSVREENSFAYSSLIRLMETERYYYLFPNRRSGYMIDKTSVDKKERKAFREFLEKKVGVQWTVPVTLRRPDLLQLIFNIKNTKKL